MASIRPSGFPPPPVPMCHLTTVFPAATSPHTQGFPFCVQSQLALNLPMRCVTLCRALDLSFPSWETEWGHEDATQTRECACAKYKGMEGAPNIQWPLLANGNSGVWTLGQRVCRPEERGVKEPGAAHHQASSSLTVYLLLTYYLATTTKP